MHQTVPVALHESTVRLLERLARPGQEVPDLIASAVLDYLDLRHALGRDYGTVLAKVKTLGEDASPGGEHERHYHDGYRPLYDRHDDDDS